MVNKILGFVNKTLYWIYGTVRIKLDPINYARSLGVNVGENARLIGLNGGTFGSEPYLIKLGNHVTVASRVIFITHDGGVWVFRDCDSKVDVVGPIVVGDNVFIGLGAIILPNVTIGNNVVIGAGSLVTKDIPSNSVAAGSPARVLQSIDEYKEKVYRRTVDLSEMSGNEKKECLVKLFEDKLN